MPRVADHVVEERRRRLTKLLGQRRYMPVAELARRLGISEATARRDLAALSRQKKLRRTFGGAVSTAATLAEFDLRHVSFADRAKFHAAAKRRIAEKAMGLVEPPMTLFIDAGTTLDHLAALLAEAPPNAVRGVTVVTHSLAVVDRLASAEAVEAYLLAGRLLARQSIVLGEHTLAAAERFEIDLAFLGAEAWGPAGLANTHPEVVRLQRRIVERAKRSAVCLDASKIGLPGPHILLSPDEIDLVVTDAGPRQLADAGIALRPDQLLRA